MYLNLTHCVAGADPGLQHIVY